MSKPNKRHNEKCKQYKTEGRREKNKAIKQERHKKRMAGFEKSREEGKTYLYVPPETAIEKTRREVKSRKAYESSMPEFKRTARIFGRLNSFVRRIKEEERMEEIKNRKVKTKGKFKEEKDGVTVWC